MKFLVYAHFKTHYSWEVDIDIDQIKSEYPDDTDVELEEIASWRAGDLAMEGKAGDPKITKGELDGYEAERLVE